MNRLAAFLLACLLVGSASPCPAANVTSQARSLYKKEHKAELRENARVCRAKGGKELYRGLGLAPFCVIATHDAGKSCQSGAECKGMCGIDIDHGNQNWRSISKGEPATGQCTAEKTAFGCYIPVEGGKAGQGFCQD